VAILGGGVGAVTAAYAITQVPDWASKYEVTVYQMGWRLGGKGASGRNLEKNGRIEEHGLHIWAGFYDNSFRLMRDCYEQLAALGLRSKDAPLGTLEKAFKPLNHFFIAEDIKQADGSIEWQPWRIDFEPNDDIPGEGGELPSPFAYFQMFVEFLTQTLEKLERAVADRHLHAHAPPPLQPGVRAALLHAGVDTGGGPSHGGYLIHLAHRLSRSLHPNANLHRHFHWRALSALLDDFTGWVRQVRPTDFDRDPTLRRLYYILELGSATARGMVADDLFTRGFDHIDRWECSEWLMRHGASQQAVESAIFRGCYDYVFGYPGGNIDHRGVGAGTAMRGLFRLAWTYKGGLFYKMQAGMGDTIFAPYYQVLRERGVRFCFFHAVTGLRLTLDKTAIGAIDMVCQAEAAEGEYDPLHNVQSLPCWPSEPLWNQLKGGEKLKASGVNFEDESKPPSGEPCTLTLDKDFDDVVLGISLGSLPHLTKELAVESPEWKDMLAGVETVATQAMQLWLTVPSAEYGWKKIVEEFNSEGEPGPLKTVMTSFVEPLDTWADMSDLLGRAEWPPEDRPWSIAYFCSPRSETEVGQPLGRFQEQCREWMNNHLINIWPAMKGSDGQFAFPTLYGPVGADADARFDWQYFRTNDYGSERYVLSVPNTVGRRLRSDQSGFDNLYLAGDWTLNGINAGCVEAATNSGLEAAQALTETRFEIVGAQDTLPGAGPNPPGLRSRAASAAPWPLSMAYSMGRMEGWINFLPLPKDIVASLLPSGLELAPQTLTAPGYHPVTVLLNHQISVRASFLPPLPLLSSPYLEAIVAIGNVRHRQQDSEPEGLFAYLPILYLNKRLDTAAGRFFYGLNKHIAKIRMTNDEYFVSGNAGRPLLTAKFNDRGKIGQPDRFADFESVRPLLTQPMIAPRSVGRWQYSMLSFDLNEASIIPSFGNLRIEDGFFPGVPAGNYDRPALGKGPLGSFRIFTTWTITNPLDSERVKQLSDERGAYAADHPSAMKRV